MAKSAWKAAIEWFEHGDLVPLIVLISAVHYTAILSAVDHFVTATAIGLIVDLGHYRWTRAAVRYKGENVREGVARWGMAIVMTIVSFVYQQRFYEDLWLSVPLPLLIISLAWLGEKDKGLGRKKEAKSGHVVSGESGDDNGGGGQGNVRGGDEDRNMAKDAGGRAAVRGDGGRPKDVRSDGGGERAGQAERTPTSADGQADGRRGVGLKMLSDGSSVDEVAFALEVSPRTVRRWKSGK